MEGPQRRRDRRSRHVQLPSEQEHHVDRRRRAGRQRRGRSRARRVASLPRHRLPPGPHARRRVSRRQVQPARRQRAHRPCAARCVSPAFLATRRALAERYFERFATDPGCVLPPRPQPGDGQSWNMWSVLLPLTRARHRPPAVPRRARGPRHRDRCIVRGAAPVHARPQARRKGRSVSEHRAHRARDGDPAAARRDDRLPTSTGCAPPRRRKSSRRRAPDATIR